MCDRGGIGRRASLRSWYHRCVSSSLTGRTISGRGADGSAPDWGSGGRLFKSDRSDHMGRSTNPDSMKGIRRGSTPPVGQRVRGSLLNYRNTCLTVFFVNKKEPYEAYREMGYREVITLVLSKSLTITIGNEFANELADSVYANAFLVRIQGEWPNFIFSRRRGYVRYLQNCL